MASTAIKTIEQASPTIYAYTTPNDVTKKGWVKIGYTERGAEMRIVEQTRTPDIRYELLWSHDARYDGGEYFADTEFHWYLVQYGIERGKLPSSRPSEWFNFGEGNEEQAEELFRKFTFKDYSPIQTPANGTQYVLREEQAEAVNLTLAYMESGEKPAEFLWNAKPRFGKTLTTYDFVRKGNFRSVLIVTNRPAVANSWYDDFIKFIKWQEPHMFFISETDALKRTGALSRSKFQEVLDGSPDDVHDRIKQVCFVSLQDLKGSVFFGGDLEKLEWVSGIPWDLLVVDEAHEGVDTAKTDWAFSKIIRKFTLYMSGTPFKAIASSKFREEQIFNWSYADEQEKKRNWDYDFGGNPYEPLPRLNLFTYRLSAMIEERLIEGQTIGETNYDFAFDLNEFFSVEEGQTTFKHEKDVRKWLDRLTKNEKYPFSTSALRRELKHTFWLLDRVASAKALARLLKDDAVFMHYEIIIAAGDGRDLEEEAEDFIANEKSYDKVLRAIAEKEYTITISVGQLTTGVTIPPWTGVMMLSNVASPALYMQAAFRAQNPYSFESKGRYYKKENAYVFDFAPDRTLVTFDELANNLVGGDNSQDRQANVRRLLNFFPVIGEDEHGIMVPLDAAQVLTIPRTIKAIEVVKRGFMSNLLFANISGIFSLPQEIVDGILKGLPVERQGRKDRTSAPVDLTGIEVDEKGNVVVPSEVTINKKKELFGDKVFDITPITTAVDQTVAAVPSSSHIPQEVSSKIVDAAMNVAKPVIVDTLKTGFDLTNAQADKIEKNLKAILTEKIKKVENENYRQLFTLKQKAKEEIKDASDSLTGEKLDTAIKEIEARQQTEFDRLHEEFAKDLNDTIIETIEEQKIQQVEEQARVVAERNKNTKEEEIRGHLRGFARTIPSFLMAYGKRETRLCNFEDYTPEEIFLEVTGITEEQFRFLRDGGTYIDESTGEEKYFPGGLFNEIVFDEAIQEFLNIKERLADYFDESHEEDVFNYIPPQETNQIFTPKQVVQGMVQKLEDEDPRVFEDPDRTFIDVFMKSGLYITELVKRLFNNPVMKEKIPDNDQRLKHILEKQLYGLAPSDIIYHIATNYIFSFDTGNRISRKNFKSVDARPAVKEGKLKELLAATFDGLK